MSDQQARERAECDCLGCRTGIPHLHRESPCWVHKWRHELSSGWHRFVCEKCGAYRLGIPEGYEDTWGEIGG